jgi:hypothetical protein
MMAAQLEDEELVLAGEFQRWRLARIKAGCAAVRRAWRELQRWCEVRSESDLGLVIAKAWG